MNNPVPTVPNALPPIPETNPVPLQPLQVTPVMPSPSMSNIQSAPSGYVTEIAPTMQPKKSNNKVVFLIAVILILFVVGIVAFILLSNMNTPSTVVPTPAPVASAPVVQSKQTTLLAYTTSSTPAGQTPVENLNLLDLKTNTSTALLTDVSSVQISPDGKTILYINKPDPTAADIYTYNIATKQATLFLSAQGNMSGISWSKDGKEILVDQGTSIIRSISIYDFSTKTKLSSFTTSESISSSHEQYYWIDADNIVFMNNVMVPGEGKPVGTGGYSGITKLNIRTGIQTPMLVPADYTEYAFVGTDVASDKIDVVKITHTGITTTSMGTATSIYGKLDLSSGLFTEDTTVTAGSSPYDIIKALLPTDLQSEQLEVPITAVEPNTYYVIISEIVDNYRTNGKLYKVDTTVGATTPFTLVDTGTLPVTGFSIY